MEPERIKYTNLEKIKEQTEVIQHKKRKRSPKKAEYSEYIKNVKSRYGEASPSKFSKYDHLYPKSHETAGVSGVQNMDEITAGHSIDDHFQHSGKRVSRKQSRAKKRKQISNIYGSPSRNRNEHSRTVTAGGAYRNGRKHRSPNNHMAVGHAKNGSRSRTQMGLRDDKSATFYVTAEEEMANYRTDRRSKTSMGNSRFSRTYDEDTLREHRRAASNRHKGPLKRNSWVEQDDEDDEEDSMDEEQEPRGLPRLDTPGTVKRKDRHIRRLQHQVLDLKEEKRALKSQADMFEQASKRFSRENEIATDRQRYLERDLHRLKSQIESMDNELTRVHEQSRVYRRQLAEEQMKKTNQKQLGQLLERLESLESLTSNQEKEIEKYKSNSKHQKSIRKQQNLTIKTLRSQMDRMADSKLATTKHKQKLQERIKWLEDNANAAHIKEMMKKSDRKDKSIEALKRHNEDVQEQLGQLQIQIQLEKKRSKKDTSALERIKNENVELTNALKLNKLEVQQLKHQLTSQERSAGPSSRSSRASIENDRVGELHRQLEETKIDLSKTNDLLNVANDQYTKANQALRDEQRRVMDLEDIIEDLKHNQRSTKKAKTSKLDQEAIDNLNEEILKLKNREKSQNQYIEKLKSEQDRLYSEKSSSGNDTQLQEAQNEIDDFKHKLEKLNRELESQKEELEVQQISHEKAMTNLETNSKSQEKEKLDEQKASYDKKIQVLTDQLKSLRERMASDASNAESSLVEENQHLQEQVDNLSIKLEDAKALSKQELTTVSEKLNNTITKQTDDIQKLEKALKKAEANLEEEKKDAQTRLTKFKEDISDRNNSIEKLKEQITTLEKESNQKANTIVEHQNDLQTLRDECKALETKLKEEKQQHEDSNKGSAQKVDEANKRHQKELQQLRADLDAQIKEKESNHSSKLEATQKQHLEELEQLKSNHAEEMEKKNRDQESEIEKLTKQHEDTLSSLSSGDSAMKTQLESINKKNSSLEKEISTLKNENNTLEKKTNTLEDQLSSLKSGNETALQNLGKEKDAIILQLEEANEKLTNANTELNALMNENESVKHEHQHTQRELVRISSELELMKSNSPKSGSPVSISLPDPVEEASKVTTPKRLKFSEKNEERTYQVEDSEAKKEDDNIQIGIQNENNVNEKEAHQEELSEELNQDAPKEQVVKEEPIIEAKEEPIEAVKEELKKEPSEPVLSNEDLEYENMDGVSDDYTAGDKEKTRGQIRFKVIKVTDIGGKDLFSKVDPYCAIRLKNSREKTKVCKATNNPVWNEEFSMKVSNAYRQQIRVRIMDKDLLSKDDLLSEFFISLKHLEKDKTYKRRVTINDAKGNPSKAVFYYELTPNKFGVSPSASSSALDEIDFSADDILNSLGEMKFDDMLCSTMLTLKGSENKTIVRSDLTGGVATCLTTNIPNDGKKHKLSIKLVAATIPDDLYFGVVDSNEMMLDLDSGSIHDFGWAMSLVDGKAYAMGKEHATYPNTFAMFSEGDTVHITYDDKEKSISFAQNNDPSFGEVFIGQIKSDALSFGVTTGATENYEIQIM